jgi:hypothetical protein
MSVKKAATKKQQAAPVQQNVQQPQMTNEQYMLNVMTDRCKQLEAQLVAVAQEVGRLKQQYEPEDKNRTQPDSKKPAAKKEAAK